MNIVAIIPARGGSKSIPRKNVKELFGKPLISYPITLAKSIPAINKVVVSTDDLEIADIAKICGAEVPFIRPSELAQDETPTLPVLQHCVNYLEKNDGYKADIIILLYPTSPFLKKERIEESIELIKEKGYNSVIGVEKDWGRFWRYDNKADKNLVFYPYDRVNRQYYEPLCRETGAVYISDYETIMKKDKIVDEKNIGFVFMTPEENIDIDTPHDWEKAESRLSGEIKPFTIETPRGPRTIGPDHPCFIIAEMSSNHNQDFDKAVSIVKAAATAGADAIKLQTYTPDSLTMDSDKEYFLVGGEDNPDCWKGNSLYKLYQKSYTPREWHPKLKKIAEDLGLVFFSTPFSENDVDFLEDLGVPFYKVASYEVTHIPLIKKIANTGKPVIMSVGFSSLEEINLAVSTLRENGTKDIVLLHCVTSYSSEPKPEYTNLRTMIDIKQRFKVISGFSDNNAGIEIPLQAALMGASVIEKHIVDDDPKDSLDGNFSVNPRELKEFVEAVRKAEKTIGTINYGVQTSQEAYNKRFRRSIFITKDLARGDTFTEENIKILRPEFGIAPKYYDEILGKKSNSDLDRGEPLKWENVENGQS